MLYVPTALLICLFTYSIYTVEHKGSVQEIDHYYHSLLDKYCSNLSTIKNYHRNQQAILIFDNKSAAIMRDLFAKTAFKEKVYPFVLDEKGDLLIHPFSEGADVSQTFWGAKILNSKRLESSFDFFSEEYKTKNRIYFKKNEDFGVILGVVGEEDVIYGRFYNSRFILVFAMVLLLIAVALLTFYILKVQLRPLKDLYKKMKQFAYGNWSERMSAYISKEFSLISDAFNTTGEDIANSIRYAKVIGEGEVVDSNFKNSLSKTDLIDNLQVIEKNIQHAIEIEEQRKVEDEKLNWFNQGIAKFGEVLRISTNSIEELADNIIQNLVKYVGINQGGIFVVNKDDSQEPYLELVSAFAFDSKKFMEKRIEIGEGLVGTCAVELQTIHIKQTPDSYMEITSGLGDAPPRSILIVPVKLEDEVLGVIELASFYEFESHKIEFVEKIMESVASTLSSSKINQQTKELLKKFEVQSKEMAEQEEEMRQNIEELTATQEEASARESEQQAVIRAFSSSINYIEFDAEFRILDLNENFSRLFDLQYEATFGKSLNDLVLIMKARFNDVDDALRMIRQGEDVEEEHEYKINGELLKIRDRYIPVKSYNGELSKIIRIATVIM